MMKKEKGIALVSLIITIAVMTVIASTVVYVSLDRFEINSLRKMYTDIELLQDKVSNYYLKYGVLPVLRDNTNTTIQYTYTTLDFTKNSADNNVYYILDLEAMEGISLNYGETGFKNPNTSEDVYIINQKSHTIYYVKGMELNEQIYHTLVNSSSSINDTVPPSSPQINVISGKKVGQIYTTDVEIEITQGKDNWSGIGGTLYSLDNGATWQEMNENSEIISINKKGSYTIRAKSYDNASNKNYSTETELTFEIDKVVVGTYINYGVSYDDMYNSTSSATKTFGETDGWRYLGTDTDGKHLLISTGVPMILNYNYRENTNSAQWWDTDTTLRVNVRVANGMLNNLEDIPYAKVSAGTISQSNTNTMIGLFGDSNRTTVGDYFKVTGKTYSSSITVRTLTLAELNRAVNSANGNTDRAETSLSSGFKDLTGDALGLFDLSDIGLSNNYYYWLATPEANTIDFVNRVSYVGTIVSLSALDDHGIRPVVVLPSDTQFVKENGIWCISGG